MYLDTQNTHWKENPMEYEIEKIRLKINESSKLPIFLAPGGGFAVEAIKL